MNLDINSPILQVRNLNLNISIGKEYDSILKNITFDVPKAQITAIIGHSGAGKSQIAASILGLNFWESNFHYSGEIIYDQMNLLTTDQNTMQKIRGQKIAIIFQEPMASFNPLKKCGPQVLETYLIKNKIAKNNGINEVLFWFDKMNLSEPKRIYDSYPHQLSGGQLQRVMIAMAMINKPDIIIADEATSSLDASLKKEIILILKGINELFSTTIIFITHDIALIKDLASYMVILKDGQVIESGFTHEVVNQPKHEYSKDLLTIKNKYALDSFSEKPASNTVDKIALQVLSLMKAYKIKFNSLFNSRKLVTALQDINLYLEEGETLGIVGESGSGKSTLALCILRLLEIDHGKIFWNTKDVTNLEGTNLRNERHYIQMIFQDTFQSLPPHMTIENILNEALKIGSVENRYDADVKSLLSDVGLSDINLHKKPSQFSGGQRQRICIARALALRPKILVFDEALSSLDVISQQQILNLIKNLKLKHRLTYLFISHNLPLVASISDKIMVLRKGLIMDYDITTKVINHPSSEYTKQLIHDSF